MVYNTLGTIAALTRRDHTFQQGESADFIKRVIAVEGETVEIKADNDPVGATNRDCGGCGVYVNGVRLDENYIRQTADYKYASITIPPGHIFVLGDNRRNSFDSHVFGPLDVNAIRGEAFLQLEPFQFLRGPTYPPISSR